MRQVWPVLAHRVEAFERLKVKAAWAGNYDYNTWDQNGLVGRHPALPNTFLACGFSGHGIQQGPAVGRALAELILEGGFKSLDLTGLGFERVVEGRRLPEVGPGIV
jgi:FAD-dependent oxidoreductase domain-containing protein 1